MLTPRLYPHDKGSTVYGKSCALFRESLIPVISRELADARGAFGVRGTPELKSEGLSGVPV